MDEEWVELIEEYGDEDSGALEELSLLQNGLPLPANTGTSDVLTRCVQRHK